MKKMIHGALAGALTLTMLASTAAALVPQLPINTNKQFTIKFSGKCLYNQDAVVRMLVENTGVIYVNPTNSNLP